MRAHWGNLRAPVLLLLQLKELHLLPPNSSHVLKKQKKNNQETFPPNETHFNPSEIPEIILPPKAEEQILNILMLY